MRDRRERDRDRDRDRDRIREREHYRSRSPTRSRHSSSKSKKKKSKKSKKYYRRSRSSSRSSSRNTTPDSARSSSRSSRRSRSRDYEQRKSRSASQRTTRAHSSDSNSRTGATTGTNNIKTIDLLDAKVQKALETIDEDAFQPSAFLSTRDREAPEDKVIIDLNTETVTVPKSAEIAAPRKEDIFHPNFIGDAELKAEKWLRKLYNYRQKYIKE